MKPFLEDVPSIPKENEIHVWPIELVRTDSELNDLCILLSPEEVNRSNRFHFVHDRRHFVACRGILKTILAGYLACEARKIEFATSSFGKPRLAPALEECRDLQFNVSHSQGRALIAVAMRREVGIDIEKIDYNFGWQSIAQHYFSPRENTALNLLSSEQQAAAFFACWTRKEAVVKANGEGLSIVLNSFDVSVSPGGAPDLLELPSGPGGRNRITVSGLFLDDEYSAALAAKGGSFTLAWQSLLRTPERPGNAPRNLPQSAHISSRVRNEL